VKGVDFGRTAGDYAEHRPTIFPEDFERLRALGVGRPGSRVLDVGTGTGAMARGLARGGAHLIGLDPSAELLAAGRDLDRQAGLRTERVRGRAESLPFAAATFSAATALQCWHWFDAPRAARELRRVLAPNGRVAIVHFDWLPLPHNLVEATEALIRAHNPRWNLGGGDGRYPTRIDDLLAAGFIAPELFERQVDVPFTHASWRGRIRASAGVAATLLPPAVARFDTALAALLTRDYPEPLSVPHRVWAVIARQP
jgi:SAM-dependent methyltransferase